MSFLSKFEEAMRNDGIYPSCALEVTGQNLTRIHAKGDKRSTKNIAYWFVDAGSFAYGWYQHWVHTDGKGWTSRKLSSFNSEKRKEIKESFEKTRKEQELKRQHEHEQGAIKSENMWNVSKPYSDHPALTNKGFKLEEQQELKRLKINDKRSVLIPVYDADGKLWSLQRLLFNTKRDPNKLFLKGTKASGGFYVIGGNFKDLSGKVAIVEGFTTGLSIHVALNIPVIVTFSADNLLKVCSSEAMLEKGLDFIICGDDDKFNENNKGRLRAIEARDKLGCKLFFPIFKDEGTKPTDFNDLHLLEGIDSVRNQILNSPPCDDVNLSLLTENEKPIYIAKLIISKIDTCFNEISTNVSCLKLKGERKFYECNTHDFFVRIAGEYSNVFGESTNSHREISRLVECHLKSDDSGIPWIEASKPVYWKGDKVFFKTDLPGYPIYEIDKNGFRVSAEKDYTAFKNFFNKHEEDIVFRLSADKKATLNELEAFFSVKDMDLIKILAFCVSSIFSQEKYILGIFGAFGSGKDYVQTRLQEIISPLESFNRMIPNNKRDLMVVSSQTFINGYSNISFISKDFQDYFCLLGSKTSDPSRQLFSDKSVVNISAQTPIVLNGINNVIEREDLLSRMMVINLETMSSDSRVVFVEPYEKLKELQGRVQNFIFNLISSFLKDIDIILKEFRGKKRSDKVLLWMYYTALYSGIPVTLEELKGDQEQEIVNNIMANPIYMAIDNYFYFSNDVRLSGSVSDVWNKIKASSDVTGFKNMLSHHFIREVNRIDFSKTNIEFKKIGKRRVGGSCCNHIAFEVRYDS